MAVEVDVVEVPVLVISFVRQRLVVLTRENVILSSRRVVSSTETRTSCRNGNIELLHMRSLIIF